MFYFIFIELSISQFIIIIDNGIDCVINCVKLKNKKKKKERIKTKLNHTKYYKTIKFKQKMERKTTKKPTLQRTKSERVKSQN